MAEPTRQFETERTRRYRQGELSERDERTIANIETYGCQVVQVKQTIAALGWSYTIGVYDTCGKPEVITVGLPEETARYLLNQAADRLRNSINLAEGRHRDMLGDVECEFRPVDPKWARELMNWAIWYYDGAHFPVLQAVYPDLKIVSPRSRDLTKTSSNRSSNPMRHRLTSSKIFGRVQPLLCPKQDASLRVLGSSGEIDEPAD